MGIPMVLGVALPEFTRSHRALHGSFRRSDRRVLHRVYRLRSNEAL